MNGEDTIDADRYRAAGVDIDAGARLVDAIRPLAGATARPGSDGGADAGLGGFGGLFDLAAAGFRDPVLVAATDGVGTKLKLATAAGRHDGVGVDLVAMCVNDLVVQGAEPLFFLDYFASGRLELAMATEVVAGIARGCIEAGCALIGGETAEMPGMYATGDYDLAGFAVGAAERGAILTGAGIAAGDTVLGLPASGLHANGFSLVRQVVEESGAGWSDPAPFAPGRTLGEALLEPTRIYVRPCLAAIRETVAVRGLAHITGGGLIENLPRVLPDGLGAELDGGAWRAAPAFGWLAETGGIAAADMLRTFNCGIGMVAICATEGVGAVQAALAAGDVQAVPVGRIVEAGDGPRVRVGNAEAAWR